MPVFVAQKWFYLNVSRFKQVDGVKVRVYLAWSHALYPRKEERKKCEKTKIEETGVSRCCPVGSVSRRAPDRNPTSTKTQTARGIGEAQNQGQSENLNTMQISTWITIDPTYLLRNRNSRRKCQEVAGHPRQDLWTALVMSLCMILMYGGGETDEAPAPGFPTLSSASLCAHCSEKLTRAKCRPRSLKKNFGAAALN